QEEPDGEGQPLQRRLLTTRTNATAASPSAAPASPRAPSSLPEPADSLATSTTGVFHTFVDPSANVCTPTRWSVSASDPTDAEKRKRPRSSAATEPPCQLIATMRWAWSRTSSVVKPAVAAAAST